MVAIFRVKSLCDEENESYDNKEDKGYLHDDDQLLIVDVELWIVVVMILEW